MPDRFIHQDGRIHAVAVACEDAAGRWLLIRRSRHVRAPLKVAFPGGTLEEGETQAEAVVREMREELGVEVEPLQAFWSVDFPNRPLTLWAWHARLLSWDLQPCPDEVAEVLWLTPGEATAHPDRTDQMDDYIAALQQHVIGPR